MDKQKQQKRFNQQQSNSQEQCQIKEQIQFKDKSNQGKIKKQINQQQDTIQTQEQQLIQSKQRNSFNQLNNQRKYSIQQFLQKTEKQFEPLFNHQNNQPIVNVKQEKSQLFIKFNTTNHILSNSYQISLLSQQKTKEKQQFLTPSIKKIQSQTSSSIKKNENNLTQSQPIQKTKVSQSNNNKTPAKQVKQKKLKNISIPNNQLNLFTQPQSLLPNEVICIENNSTKVIVHMGKKIAALGQNNEKQISNKNQTKSDQFSNSTNGLSYLLGKLIVTNYKIVYVDLKYPNSMNFSYPLGYIVKLQRTIEQSSGISYIEILFKTGLNVKFKYNYEQNSYSQKIKDIILTLTSKSLFTAVDYAINIQKSLKCKQFQYYFQSLHKNKNMLKGIQAQVIDNSNWKQMRDYPQKYIVPINYINRKNPQYRIVILSYIYNYQSKDRKQKQKITLWRTGPGLPDVSIEDQWIPKTKQSMKHHSIQIKNKNIGSSKTNATRQIQIQGLYHLKESFYKLNSFTYHYNQSVKWFDNISTQSKWYQQICVLMGQAQYIIELMTKGIHVSLVCDTESRGAQISAIVQLLMCPQYRTFQGFPLLIEKQFLHYGSPRPSKKQRQRQKQQDKNCVYQFTHLYPLSFQFNQHYLVYIAGHIFSNKYGNFLYITRQFNNSGMGQRTSSGLVNLSNNNNNNENKQRKSILQKCACIWQDIKNKIQKDKKMFFQDYSELNNQIKNQSPMNSKAKLLSPQLNASINPPVNVNSSFYPSNQPIHQIMNYYIYFHNSFYIDHNQSNIFQLRNHNQISKGIRLWSSYFLRKGYCCESLREQILLCNQITKRYLKTSYQHNQIKKYNQIMRKKIKQQYKQIQQKRDKLKSLSQIL